MKSVPELPKRYIEVAYLHYREGRNSAEIAEMLGKKQSVVLGYLHKVREILRKSGKLRFEWVEDNDVGLARPKKALGRPMKTAPSRDERSASPTAAILIISLIIFILAIIIPIIGGHDSGWGFGNM